MNATTLEALQAGIGAVLAVAGTITILLLWRSLVHFSQTGPRLPADVLRHFRGYAAIAMGRLLAWVFALAAGMAAAGVLLYEALAVLAGTEFRVVPAVVFGFVGVLLICGLQFCRHLLYLPASIAASYGWRKSRLYPLWHRLNPTRLLAAEVGLAVAAAGVFAAAAASSAGAGNAAGTLLNAICAVAALGALLLLQPPREPAPVRSASDKRLNVLMIGCDTLRADRIGTAGYHRPLTPFIDSLARRGTAFTSCYVPCARTAPSLLSLLTGTWPHVHGVRDNFVSDAETKLNVPSLPELLHRHGYRTGAVSDWCGGDFGKFSLGFDDLDLPHDQWNIKYLIRQGPKDLRLFLSLFTHNRFGKLCLPELYYLGGVPMTRQIGRDARQLLARYAGDSAPFLLNVFTSSTHPPFGSEWPHYRLFSDSSYEGESKFVMARLTDPWEIIRRQGEPREEFDLDQIIDLYDGSVRSFDDEVARIIQYLRACDLEKNTLIVIYSDHGMEFFERGTWGQGNSVLTEASSRTPLVVVDPRRAGAGASTRVVRSIDVAPTLLDLAGLPIPPTMNGVSLRRYIEDPQADLALAACNETGLWLTELPGMRPDHLRYPGLLDLLDVPDERSGTLAIKEEYRAAIVEAKDRMVRRGCWKLVVQPTTNGPVWSLFDVEADPGCRQDLAARHPAVVADLKEFLLDWMGPSTAASTARFGDEISAPGPARPAPAVG
jgi:arylsulfatase A-like enzyme